MWALFLDDDRYPVDLDKYDWKIARNVDDAMWYVRNYGLPAYMSLDHDLGAGRLTGHDFIKMLVSHLIDSDQSPKAISCFVHSQNPVGAANIQGYWANFCDWTAAN